jgi:hypothetical protein
MFELPIFDCAYFTIRHGIKYQEIMETVHGIANRQQISTFGLECCYVFQGIKAVYARYQGQFKTSFSCYIYLIVNFTKCRGRGRLALAVNFSILQKESDKQAGNPRPMAAVTPAEFEVCKNGVLLWWQLHIAIFNIHQKIVQDKDTISPF